MKRPFWMLAFARADIQKLEHELQSERLVSANRQMVIDMLTEHRDVLLGNIRDLRIECSGLRRDKVALAMEISELLDANRRRVERRRRR
jgi:hypothetical protein